MNERTMEAAGIEPAREPLRTSWRARTWPAGQGVPAAEVTATRRAAPRSAFVDCAQQVPHPFEVAVLVAVLAGTLAMLTVAWGGVS